MLLKEINDKSATTLFVAQRGQDEPNDMFVAHALGKKMREMGGQALTDFSWKFKTPEEAQKALVWAQAFIVSMDEDAPGLFTVDLK